MTNSLKNYFLSKTFNSQLHDTIWDIDSFDSKNIHTKTNDIDKLDTIKYEVNEYGYRTSEETNDFFNENLIGCFGCSNTFGMAIEYKYTWPFLLNKFIGDEWCVKNYGVPGGSNDNISRLIYNFVSNKKPKIICCLFPDFFRMEFFDVNSDLKNFRKTENKEILKTYSFIQHEFYMAYKKISTEDNGIYNFIKNFKFIQNLCDNKNIKFYWSTWARNIYCLDKSFIERHLNINNYVDLSHLESNIDYGLDGIHFGPNTSKNIAKEFYDKITSQKP